MAFHVVKMRIHVHIPLKIALHHHNRNNSAINLNTSDSGLHHTISHDRRLGGIGRVVPIARPLPSSKCSVVYVIILESPKTRLVPISIRAISMHRIESRDISNRKYLSKTILASQKQQQPVCPL